MYFVIYLLSILIIFSYLDALRLKQKKKIVTKYEEISSALKNGDTVTYNDFKEKVGGVDGTPVTKSYISTSYKCVNKKGGYLKTSFNNKTKKCTFVSVRI